MATTNFDGMTEEQMKNETLVNAVANPGTLQIGAQTGMTPSGQGLAPVATNWQAMTTMAGTTPPPTKQVDVVTSKKADNYVQQLASLANTPGTPENYLSQMQGNISADTKNALIKQLPPEDPNETSQERNLREAVQNGGIAGLSAGNALTALIKMRENRIKIDQAKKNLTEDQASTAATQAASAFKMGQSGSAFATAAMAKLQDRQKQVMDEFNEQKQKALNAAWDAALSGNYQDAERLKAEAKRIADQQRISVKEQIENQKSMLEYGDLLEKHGNAVVDRMVASGYEPTEMVLAANDERWKLPPGTSQISYEIAKKNAAKMNEEAEYKRLVERAKTSADLGKTEAETAKIYNEIKNTSLNLAKDTVSMLEKIPIGQSIVIDGKSYSGWNSGGLKQGIEIDDNGMGTGWTFNPVTQKWSLEKLGNIGASKDGWELVQTNQGLFNYNKNTAQLVPVEASVGQPGGWNELLPEGADGGQCGAFANDCGQFGFGDSWQSKQDKTDSTIGSANNPLQIGDGVVMKIGGWTGHAAVVQAIAPNPKDPSTPLIQIVQSNKNGDEKITREWLPANDPRITGYAHPRKMAPALQTGSGSMPLRSGGGGTVSGSKLSLVDNTKPVQVSAGAKLVDPVTGQVIYSSPKDETEPKLVSVAPGTSLYDPKTGKAVFTAPKDMQEAKPTYLTDEKTGTVYAISGTTATPVDLVSETPTTNVAGPMKPGTGVTPGAIAAIEGAAPTPVAQPTVKPKLQILGKDGKVSELDKPLDFDELEKYNKTLPANQKFKAGTTLRDIQNSGFTPGEAGTGDTGTQFQVQANELVDTLLAHPGLNSAVGVRGLSSLFGLKGALPWTEDKPFSGSPAASFVAQYDRLRSLLTVPNLKLMKGLGQMSEKELKVIEDAATSISREMSNEEFRTELKRVKEVINRTLQNAGIKVVEGSVYSKGDDGQWYKTQ